MIDDDNNDVPVPVPVPVHVNFDVRACHNAFLRRRLRASVCLATSGFSFAWWHIELDFVLVGNSRIPRRLGEFIQLICLCRLLRL